MRLGLAGRSSDIGFQVGEPYSPITGPYTPFADVNTTRCTPSARAASRMLTRPITLTWMLSAGLAADTAPTKAAACTTCVVLCFLIVCRIRGMSSTSPCSKSSLSAMSPIRLSSRWRANTTGRWPSLMNLRVVSAPMTPMPPVIRTFIFSSVDFRADGFDQTAPVLEVALNQVAELLRRQVDPLEAVGAEELLGLGKLQHLGDVGLDLRQDCGRQLRRSPQTEPDRCLEAWHGLGDRWQIRQGCDPFVRCRCDQPH